MNNYFLAFFLATLLCLLLGPLIIPLLRFLKFGQTVRSEGPQRHLQKTGTPTMGGVMFIVAITLTTLVLASRDLETLLVLVIFTGFGLVGFIDDFIKVVMRRSLGLKARYKLLGQVVLGLALGFLAVWLLGRGTVVELPKDLFRWDLGGFYPLFVLLVLVATTNAVNLTDGLDGLAAGVTVFSSLALAVIALLQEQSNLAVFAFALAGGCFGFLAFNKYPAKVFMGDTGSLALGAGLGALAVLTRTELILPVIGGVYVLEALSVILQVASFKLTGKRILRMSPLHHHFELLGWKETKVVGMFWLVGLLCAFLGLLFWY